MKSTTTLLSVAACLYVLAGAAYSSDYQVRPSWGDGAMWGYWEFGNDYLAKKDWKVIAVSGEVLADSKAHNIIDGDANTCYDPNGRDSYEVTIDMGVEQEVAGFTILTMERPDNNRDSMMARYEFMLSANAQVAGEPIAKGDFIGTVGTETVVSFPVHSGRYVTLRAFPRTKGNDNREVCIRELSLFTPAGVAAHAKRMEYSAGRAARWQNRDSDPATIDLAKDFFQLLWGHDLDHVNVRMRDKLVAACKLEDEAAAAKPAEVTKHLEALRQFREYYFDKLRRPQIFGYNAADVHPYGRGSAGQNDFPQSPLDKNADGEALEKDIPVADQLMKGDMRLGGKLVHIGEPGTVDWEAPDPPYGWRMPGGRREPWDELTRGSGFLPLFGAYWATKNTAYLKRWVDYMDDWSMNARYLHELHPIFNSDNGRFPEVTTIRLIAGAALELPVNSPVFSPQAFARIMRKLVTESVLNDIVYYRSAQMGWVPGAGRMLFPMLIDEFRVAPIYFRETRRRNIEDFNTVQSMRDGTEPHQWPGYNWLGVVNMGALRLMSAREALPVWAQPNWEKDLHSSEWRAEFIESLAPRARYQIHWVTPDGQYPLSTHHQPPSEKGKMHDTYVQMPEALDDPTTGKLFSYLYGDGLQGKPEWTSEWFPYGGYSIARTGWGLGEGYGSMFCSPHCGLGSAGCHIKNNAFCLNAYGADLLDDDLVHTWIPLHITSPINVDKKMQCFNFNEYVTQWPSEHKADMVTAWTEPAPWRWHSSGHFDVMEGVYSGVYDNDRNDRTDVVRDVSHQRVALFARHAGLWILTDHMNTAAKHDYEQTWFIPLKKRQGSGFKAEDIIIDQAAKTIKTKRTYSDHYWSYDYMRDIVIPNANLSLYQFSDAPMTYTSESRNDDAEQYAFQRIGGSWSGTGPQQVVTLLFPRRPVPESAKPVGTENDLTSITSLKYGKASGFTALTPTGDHVSYLAVAGSADSIEIDGIKVVGEALLVTHAPGDAQVRGIVLGCKSISVRGGKTPTTPSDFEFTLPVSMDAAKLTFETINRPISPVTISPQSDVFVDHQLVTLASTTPGVRITYTLDGTEPTPQSKAYSAPFEIDHSVMVKVRAYRPGVTLNPPQTSGTEATPVSFARYDKRLYDIASDANPQSHGLSCEYYQDFWKDMWLAIDRCTPIKKSTVTELFDMSQIPADNRPLGDHRVPCEKPYAFRYSGFLKVPQDGIYVLHAPREFVYNDTMAGYELEVWVGHASYMEGDNLRREGDMSYWYPATRLHGLGTWSVPLQKGCHEFKLLYIDFRMDGPKRLNQPPPIHEYVWSGERPNLLISGPGLEKAQPIPAAWLWH